MLTSGEAIVPFFLRFFLVEDLEASGEVDMCRSGSSNPLATVTLRSFFLRFRFCVAPLGSFAACEVETPLAAGPPLYQGQF